MYYVIVLEQRFPDGVPWRLHMGLLQNFMIKDSLIEGYLELLMNSLEYWHESMFVDHSSTEDTCNKGKSVPHILQNI